MSIKKKAALSLALFSLIFSVLVLHRIDRRAVSPDPILAGNALTAAIPGNRDTWMEIRQEGRPIGYSHRVLERTAAGFTAREKVVMRINTMGIVQQIQVTTGSRLNVDFSLSSFDFTLESGLFGFSASGKVEGDVLLVTTGLEGDIKTHRIPLDHPVRLGSGIFQSLAAAGLEPGRQLTYDIFDPATLSNTTVTVTVGPKDHIAIGSRVVTATVVELAFRGMRQKAWIAENGEVVRESGLLGIVLVKSNREEATRAAYGQASEDLTLRASVPVKETFAEPSALALLRVQLSGVSLENLTLDGGRQVLDGDILTIRRESLPTASTDTAAAIPAAVQSYLEASAFVQSDHEKIAAVIREIMGQAVQPSPATPVERRQRAAKIVAWVHTRISKRPVLSMPDAISTLDNRVGDCNEHAVLTAALARAAGVPARIEAGLVYMKGRFYYHAWNAFYLADWATADTTLGQLPADVTHIRMTVGEADAQLELMGVLGEIGLEVLDYHHD